MNITIMVLKKMDHIMVTGREYMNGNAYTTVEKKGDNYYYSEYGKNNYRKFIGTNIV